MAATTPSPATRAEPDVYGSPRHNQLGPNNATSTITINQTEDEGGLVPSNPSTPATTS